MNGKRNERLALLAVAAAAGILCVLPPRTSQPGAAVRVGEATRLIVQAHDLAAAAAAVRSAGGEITHELGIIDAVGARLTASQVKSIQTTGTVRIYADETARTAAPPVRVKSFVPLQVGARLLHDQGIVGSGVTIAVLDTGLWATDAVKKNDKGVNRLLQGYDAIGNVVGLGAVGDRSGHGTHVASVAVNVDKANGWTYNGVAPGANLVIVQSFDSDGKGTYANVIRGIDWIVTNRATYNIRILNCSFSAPVRSWYWEDPLNQAIMRAWQAGIVVVTSAGNGGPQPMTIGVPGNVPYVITVGAMTDYYTTSNENDDRLASFSAAGPTYEGFVKPDVVTVGGHVPGIMNKKFTIPRQHGDLHDEGNYFVMSGTSQAAAVVSGIVALMLQKNPVLTPDDVKCGLMATADVAWNGAATPYSVFQQGAGLVRAHDAVYGGTTRCANNGLDIAKDVAGTRHYAGTAAQDATGRYYLMDETGSGTTWDGTFSKILGYPWSNGYPWSSGYPWSNGYPWSSSYPWSNGYPWSDGYPWSAGLAEPASINTWVPQE